MAFRYTDVNNKSHQDGKNNLNQRQASNTQVPVTKVESKLPTKNDTSWAKACRGKQPSSDDELCNNSYCTECRRRRAGKSPYPTSISDYLGWDTAAFYARYSYKDTRQQPIVEEGYQPDTEDNFRLMMPLLNCEREDCLRCYPTAIVSPFALVGDVMIRALHRVAWGTTEKEHYNMCRFQAERKCRTVWSSETHHIEDAYFVFDPSDGDE